MPTNDSRFLRELTIRALKPEEAVETASLVERIFEKFVAPDYSTAGVEHFKEFITHEAIARRLGEGSIALVATYHEEIVGFIEIRDLSHIALLFTSEEWHNRGVAKRLLDKAVERCRERNRDMTQLTVNSSPYAVPVYRRLGFAVIEREQEMNGIRFIVMSKKF